MTLSRSAARRLTERVLSFARLDDVRVRVSSRRHGNTRFANNEVTTTGDVEERQVSVTATIDGRSATVTSNRFDDGALEALVRDAEATAALSPPDPEHMPPLGAQRYRKVAERDAATATLGAEARVGLIEPAIAVGVERGLTSAGLVTHEDSAFAIGNRAGLFAHHASTSVATSTTCRTADGTGSGRAAFESHRVAGLDARALALVAADKAAASARPEALEPGRFVVVLEPAAVADLLGFLVAALDARRADEGRSWFSVPGGGTRVGEKLFHESVTLWSDPADPAAPASPIGEDGLPHGKVTWIDKGVLRALACSRFWAQKQGREPLPAPSAVHLEGTQSPLSELVRGVDRGILVTRFWYNRMLEPRTILATGLTRDGTFLVEKGKVVSAVKNFRYNDSPVTLLRNVLALGKPERTPGGERRVMVVPPMVVEGFNFASLSDAV
jgi:predicted Zn-dependent protease